jgi:hypothetical protein
MRGQTWAQNVSGVHLRGGERTRAHRHTHMYLTGVGLPPSIAAGTSKVILSEAWMLGMAPSDGCLDGSVGGIGWIGGPTI